MRHEHLLGLIGRSHSIVQAQAEEREESRRLDWDRGNTIFTSSAKRKAESQRMSGKTGTVTLARFYFSSYVNGHCDGAPKVSVSPIRMRWDMPMEVILYSVLLY